jgi:Sec-independent protein secretion pathway component TatC
VYSMAGSCSRIIIVLGFDAKENSADVVVACPLVQFSSYTHAVSNVAVAFIVFRVPLIHQVLVQFGIVRYA